ncbi:MAG: hypothetical protein ACLP8X_12155 [Streptosporangiaceae bacterium]
MERVMVIDRGRIVLDAAPGRPDLSDRVIPEPRQPGTEPAVLIWGRMRAMTGARSFLPARAAT